MDITRVLFVNISTSSAASTTGGIWIPPFPTCDFPAIYNFSDSNSDTGGISAAFWPIPPPYGVSYFHRPAGRNSDGRLIIDFIAENVGLPYFSLYLDSLGTNFRHGTNFAAGRSMIRRQNESIFENGMSPFSLDIQTMQFHQFKSRTGQIYDQARNPFKKSRLPRPREFSMALYTFDISQNDLAAGFRKLTMPQFRAAIPDIMNLFSAARLYHQGARAFWIHNIGPIGCLPAATFYIRNPKLSFLDKYGCIRAHNAMAVLFNGQFKVRVSTLRAEFPHATLIYIDIYSAKYQLIRNAELYRFKVPANICCGHHRNNIHVWCDQRLMINGSEIVGSACGSPKTCISWDGEHYSQVANQWIANHIHKGSFSDPQKPISQSCFKH